MVLRVGIDVGGTFTDFCITCSETSKRWFAKTRSTPGDPPKAIAAGLEDFLARLGCPPREVAFVGHGTTTATNMLIERRGAKTAFLTTSGFRDVLELGRQARPHLYDYRITRPAPLVRRAWRFEVAERLDARGAIIEPLDRQALAALLPQLLDLGIEALAIGFLHSYRNPDHEYLARDILAPQLPGVTISLSHEISPEPREFERFSTVSANAFIAPRMAAYADRLQVALGEIGIEVPVNTISSNGGLLDPRTMRAEPIRTALSGPAAGVVGAARLSIEPASIAITFDVGGTSTDIALLRDGRPGMSADRLVAGLPIRTPMVDMEVIGAGGGSIARVDHAGALLVGPASAGADPGPVAYGLGGAQPTLSDAVCVLGWLNPRGLLDGQVPLDIDAARRAIERCIAEPLGLDVMLAAQGIVRISIANMARAIRSLCVRQGVEAQSASLLAYGGAGPLMAAHVAASLGIGHVVIPSAPGTLCAQAMLVSDMAFDLTTSLFLSADPPGWRGALDQIARLRIAGQKWLDAQAVVPSRQAYELRLEARYVGQNFEIGVALDADAPELAMFKTRFHDTHRRELGFALPDQAIELVTLRLKAIGRLSGSNLPSADTAQPQEGAKRLAMMGDHRAMGEVAVLRRETLAKGACMAGPLIVEEMSTTTIVPNGWSLLVLEDGALALDRSAS